ncbi:MAG: CAP domain-containing protein [Candidatus Thiodiazotropha lotti]|nr:CAP domain-containing protein [Candidatus Thiodiazotropha lotti]MCG7986092.1 CAP domain-containing protein [Candidatus Thiodiazotropha lotti]MCG8012747.1 CAP domain-containing protein [Candidatus Thiodiazotropha lotti]MCW4212217.1 CAP domain-containing protein [Candidatus Thiodiazotropha lotti]MCW4214422.1 CAP domain-containing protein [Candidatus Thiodiazotropha lotti]
MKDKYNLPLITTVAMLCTAAAGCGGDSETNSSSTNDTEQREAANYSSGQYGVAHRSNENNENSQERYSRSRSNWRSNTRPVADISGSHNYYSGETVSLDGSGSYDEDGDRLRYYWRQVRGPRIAIDNRFNDTLAFVAPEVTEPTQAAFYLIVYDGRSVDIAGFSLQISPPEDGTAPTVIQRFPATEQADVATKIEVSLTFDEALSEYSIDMSSLTLSDSDTLIPGSVSYDDISHSILFTPYNELAEGTRYTVSLGDGVKDLAGNPVAPESWQFTTAEAIDTPDDGGDDQPVDRTPDDGSDDTPDDGTDDSPDDGSDDTPVDNSNYNLGPTSQQTINACMNDADKQMLTLVNNARAQTRSCGTESYQAAPALAWNCQLENAATAHSKSMADNNYFSHTGQDGSTPGDRITAAGYNWRTYGENIAAGYRDAETVMDGWLTSPGHCANLMNSRFRDIGVGVVNGNGSYGIYWTQNFAAQ